MDHLATKTVKKTVVILDNSPIINQKSLLLKLKNGEKKMFDLFSATVFSRVKPNRNTIEKNKVQLVKFRCLSSVSKPQRQLKFYTK
jgi:hypothetical protein